MSGYQWVHFITLVIHNYYHLENSISYENQCLLNIMSASGIWKTEHVFQ